MYCRAFLHKMQSKQQEIVLIHNFRLHLACECALNLQFNIKPWYNILTENNGLQAECVQHGVRTIAFCKTRKLCELVITYTREMLRTSAPHLSHAISVYRGGYSPTVSSMAALKAMHQDIINWQKLTNCIIHVPYLMFI